MKTPFIACLALFLVTAPTRAQNAEPLRTDINPALLYYQAFLVAPDWRQQDEDDSYLETNEWKAPHLDAHFGELIDKNNSTFRLVHVAARSKAPCDWGIDWSPGPATLLPHLGKSKRVAITAQYRLPWELQNGRQDDAREDFLATLALARNATRDGTLISVLVQLSMENILCSSFAENFGRFSPDQLQKIADGMDAAPVRGTVSTALTSERFIFIHNSLLQKVEEMRKANSTDDQKAMDGIRELVTNAITGETDFWPRVEKASGGTSEGVVRLLHEQEDSYQQITRAVTMQAEESQAKVEGLKTEVINSPNPFIAATVPAFLTARERELRVLTYLAMVRAAVEFKLHGEAGLKSVPDPFGNDPFKFERFSFEGVDRGFKLTSAFNMSHNKAVLIFVEKEGPPFNVGGNNPGTPRTPAATTK